MIPTPVPTIDPQRIILLHSIQNHTIPVLNAFLLGIILNFPDPFHWVSETARFDLYFSLTKLPIVVATSHHFSPLWALVFIEFYPLLLLAIVVLLIIFLVHLFKALKLLTESLLTGFLPQKEKTYLELVFPSVTAKTALATEQLYKLLHVRGRQKGFFPSFFKQKKIYSLEIVSSRDAGIRYIMAVPKTEADLIHQSLLSYLPGLKVREVPDYLTTELGNDMDKLSPSLTGAKKDNKQEKEENRGSITLGVIELSLSGDFSLPLQNQKILEEHDPISFLTGTMTKLTPGELIAFQIVSTPVSSPIQSSVWNRIKTVTHTIAQGKPLAPVLQPSLPEKIAGIFPINFLVLLCKIGFSILKIAFLFVLSIPSALSDSSGRSVPFLMAPAINIPTPLNAYEQELHQIVKEKLGQHLFETTIRILVATKDEATFDERADSIIASVGPFTSSYQSLTPRGSILPSRFLFKQRLSQFKKRQLSQGFGFNTILSASEMADLYHFPNTDVTKVAGLVKSKSRDLPAPLSMKKSTADLNIIVGKNTYGGEDVAIGLTREQRQRHMYVIGKTGMGKTVALKNMIYQDMKNGEGLAVIDPHGDLFKELLQIVPKNRRKDVVVFDPADREWPVGLNILSSGIHFTNPDEGNDWITSCVLAVSRKLTEEKFWGPRLEHILRNATLTALLTPNPSLYTIQKLLTEGKVHQKEITEVLSDPVLKQFWENEFSLFGKMQQAEAVSPITNKVGKFITSKMSRNILLQEKSTINIQEIMDSGKILLVNLSKGELGEDQSFFFGSLIISLIQLAAYQRIHTPEDKRRDFFLYVDEFQNFATHMFEEMSSEGRKWHVPLITSHQNIAQIKDPSLLQIVAGNADTLLALKCGPDDEDFILPFMAPEVEKGGIVNLPPYHFYMKTTNKDAEDAFSGETELLGVKASEKTAQEVIDYSRTHYATPRQEVEKQLEALFANKKENDTGGKTRQTTGKPRKNRRI